MLTATSKAVFPSCFLPSVEYMMLLHQYTEVAIDVESIYTKQRAHNRCFILAPNGIQKLTIPVAFHYNEKSPVKAIQISYAEPWPKLHLGAIKAAYGRSAWFEFLYDDLEIIFNTRYQYLYEMNNALLEFVLRKIKSQVRISMAENGFENKSILSSAKSTDPLIVHEFKSYAQVFQDRFGFTKNLSCLDLLFNTGNTAVEYLS